MLPLLLPLLLLLLSGHVNDLLVADYPSIIRSLKSSVELVLDECPRRSEFDILYLKEIAAVCVFRHSLISPLWWSAGALAAISY